MNKQVLGTEKKINGPKHSWYHICIVRYLMAAVEKLLYLMRYAGACRINKVFAPSQLYSVLILLMIVMRLLSCRI